MGCTSIKQKQKENHEIVFKENLPQTANTSRMQANQRNQEPQSKSIQRISYENPQDFDCFKMEQSQNQINHESQWSQKQVKERISQHDSNGNLKTIDEVNSNLQHSTQPHQIKHKSFKQLKVFKRKLKIRRQIQAINLTELNFIFIDDSAFTPKNVYKNNDIQSESSEFQYSSSQVFNFQEELSVRVTNQQFI